MLVVGGMELLVEDLVRGMRKVKEEGLETGKGKEQVLVTGAGNQYIVNA